MLFTAGPLYQPTTELLWTFAQTLQQPHHPSYPYYVRAKAILTAVNTSIQLKPDRIGVRDADQPKVWRLLMAGDLSTDPPQCTCNDFRLAPLWIARSLDGRRGFNTCPHTMAWNAYAAILNDHWRTLRNHAPLAIAKREYWTGTLYKLGPWTTLIDFARWLHRQPAGLVAHSVTIAHSQYQPHSAPAHRH